MSHFITLPVNQDGMVFDPQIIPAIRNALNLPFAFRDVFVYSHGWSTNASVAMAEYGRFSIAFARMLLQVEKEPGILTRPPRDTFGVGIHWPSQITEDPGSPLNAGQLFTFYSMEHRADAVGKNAVYSVLRLMLQAQPALPLRFFLIGHSFGCRVMCAALQDVYADLGNPIEIAPGTEFRVALLEPAMDQDNLNPGDIYGDVGKLPGLQMLITTSQLDEALNVWFPLAGKTANLLHHGDPPVALGVTGPSAAAANAFGTARKFDVDEKSAVGSFGPMAQKLLTANLTPLHTFRRDQKLWSGGFSGSHSDIDNDQVHALLASFFFGPP